MLKTTDFAVLSLFFPHQEASFREMTCHYFYRSYAFIRHFERRDLVPPPVLPYYASFLDALVSNSRKVETCARLEGFLRGQATAGGGWGPQWR